MLADDALAGRAALVTGGGSGIGRALALGLAAAGADVAVLGRRGEELAATVAEIEDTHGRRALAVPADVRDRSSVEEAVGRASAGLGTVSLLVNAAAGNFRVAPEDLSPRGWDAVTRIVLDGTWHTTQVVAAAAAAAGAPLSVLSIGTVGAERGGPQTVHSASAKAGVLAMTRSLAVAWGPRGVRLNVVTPGITEDTPGARILLGDDEAVRAVVEDIPLGRAARLRDVVDAGLFLLSDHADHVTGVNLVVDGGRSLGRA